MTISMFDRYRAEGEQQGRRESLLELLEMRFGPLSEDIQQRVTRIPADRLKELFRAAANATSLQDVGLPD